MKKETKELIEWIKNSLSSYITASFDTFANTPAENSFQRENCNKAIKFLDSLPEIESHLCRGGYIQDKNGTPCRDGDKISFRIDECNPIYFNNHLLSYKSILTGYLRWTDFKGGFNIVYTEEKKYISNTLLLTLIDVSEFEKVEK